MARRRLRTAVGWLGLTVLVACTSASASPSAPPSASPSSPASPAGSEPAVALPTWGVVVADTMPLTADPGGGPTVATLSAGSPVLLVEEAAADPNQILVLGVDDVGPGAIGDELAIPFGWAAERSGDTEQLAREPVECHVPPLTVHRVWAREPDGGFVCHGNEPIEIIGYLVEGCGSGASPRTGEPEWLNGTFSSVPVTGAEVPAGADLPEEVIFLRASPGVTASTCAGLAAGWYRFEGHYDDPASSTCRTTWSNGTVEEVDPALAEVLCRLRFAITGVTPTTPPQ